MNKTLYILTGIILCAYIITSCEKKDDDTLAPGPVKDISFKAAHGKLMFAWSKPEDADLHYIDISFTNANGKSRSEKVSSFASADTITGFADSSEYAFKFTAYDKSGNASEPVIIKARPKAPAFSVVVKTIKLEPDFGGARVTWDNVTGDRITVQVVFKDNAGKKLTKSFTSSAAHDVGMISELNTNEREFLVSVADAADNISNTVTFTFSPLEESLIDKSGWTVVSFSSEEPAESPNGFAANIFDKNVNTFWHTAWAGAQPGYPHWVIVDMHREITISRFECFRRQGDGRGQTSHQFLTSKDGVNWVDQGTFPFNSQSNSGQSYRMSSNPTARYFKYIATEGPNFYAFLGELNVYGSVN